MSRETEKAMKAMHEFISENIDLENMPEEEVNSRLDEYMQNYNNNLPIEELTEKTAKTADDFVELAEYAEDDAAALKYSRKALKLDPDNLDAERIVAMAGSRDPIDLIKKLERAVARGDQVMQKKGLFDEESIGEFWGILETRPYMRLLHDYMEVLSECGMVRKAEELCEKMIHLSDNDNLGVRYRLMHLYAFFEEEEKALELYSRYEGDQETQMLLPLSVLYFKKGDWSTAEKYLKLLSKLNKDTGRFIKAVLEDDLDRYTDEMSGIGYRPYSIEELLVDLVENRLLFENTQHFFLWAYDCLKAKR